jgi:hypothetical protein
MSKIEKKKVTELNLDDSTCVEITLLFSIEFFFNIFKARV